MGEQQRRNVLGFGAKENGMAYKTLQQGQQVRVDLENAKQLECECGCKHFISAATMWFVSALVSPMGQDMVASRPVMVCMECKKEFAYDDKGKGG